MHAVYVCVRMLHVYLCVNQASVVALCEVLNELGPCRHLLRYAMLARWPPVAQRLHIVAFDAVTCVGNLFLVH